MLGLMRGTSAGDTRAELAALMLPRFLLPRPALLASFLSRRMAAGVLAVIGEPARLGLSSTELDRVDAGVLRASSFGVFRDEDRAEAGSAASTAPNLVLSWARAGCRPFCARAASGRARISRLVESFADALTFWMGVCRGVVTC